MSRDAGQRLHNARPDLGQRDQGRRFDAAFLQPPILSTTLPTHAQSSVDRASDTAKSPVSSSIAINHGCVLVGLGIVTVAAKTFGHACHGVNPASSTSIRLGEVERVFSKSHRSQPLESQWKECLDSQRSGLLGVQVQPCPALHTRNAIATLDDCLLQKGCGISIIRIITEVGCTIAWARDSYFACSLLRIVERLFSS
jgi:hypothetical protein